MSTPFQLDPDDPPPGIEIRISYDCNHCRGTGAEEWGNPPKTSPCMFCECGKKEVVVPLSDFVKLLARHHPGPAQAPVAPTTEKDLVRCRDCTLWQRRVGRRTTRRPENGICLRVRTGWPVRTEDQGCYDGVPKSKEDPNA